MTAFLIEYNRHLQDVSNPNSMFEHMHNLLSTFTNRQVQRLIGGIADVQPQMRETIRELGDTSERFE